MVHPLNALVHRSHAGDVFTLTVLHPRMDVILLDTTIVWNLELPGLCKEDVDLHLLHHHISVQGRLDARADYFKPGAAQHLAERSFGCFNVQMTAPVGLAEQDISASMQDGVVRVELPRKPKKLLREEKKVEVA